MTLTKTAVISLGEYCDSHLAQARAKYEADAVPGTLSQTDVTIHKFACVWPGCSNLALHRLMYQRK